MSSNYNPTEDTVDSITTIVAIALGYLISDDPVITKLVFSFCAISISRLVEHISDDRPEKIKTLISYFLNYDLFMDKIREIDNDLDDLLKKLTKITNRAKSTKNKMIIDNIKEALEDQKKEYIKILNTRLFCIEKKEKEKILDEVIDVIEVQKEKLKVTEEAKVKNDYTETENDQKKRRK
ncbi:13054_t:CDS:2, partial [Gigaspora margarita]